MESIEPEIFRNSFAKVEIYSFGYWSVIDKLDIWLPRTSLEGVPLEGGKRSTSPSTLATTFRQVSQALALVLTAC
jgi:hypothetical protein